MAQSTSAPVRPALMNIEQVAERLGVSVRHMRCLVAERRIPFVKWGQSMSQRCSASQVPNTRRCCSMCLTVAGRRLRRTCST